MSKIGDSFDDYTQSANTLFHFMHESKYLKSILINRAIIPRYCIENFEYLHIHNKNVNYKEVAILQKCFCDIPLHKITDTFELKGVGNAYQSLTDNEKYSLEKNNSHPAFYGKFAIAFSKTWGENKNFQPIHYLNENSLYTTSFIRLLNNILNTDNISEEYARDVLNTLLFIKPLRGIIKRVISENITIEFYKNFHDEQEWRYTPDPSILSTLKLESMIANPKILNISDNIKRINNSLEKENFRALWLEYNYKDIRYIIVPDSSSKNEIINTIIHIPNKQFDSQSDVLNQKYALISKILVLEEIRKDL